MSRKLLLLIALFANPISVFCSTDTHWVQPVLVIPKDTEMTAELKNFRRHILNSTRMVQQQWASWDLSFNLKPQTIVVRSNQTTEQM